jgi:capsular polysaccharide biosynthesis protein
MDLLSIIWTVWRHKFAVLPVILLTVIGAFYVIKIKPPVYQAASSILLVNPPAPPTAAQIAADPGLAGINANNPYTNFGNLTIVVDVVINLVTADSSQQALVQAGADPRYQVALSSAFDSPPIIQITGVASSAQEAIKTANLVAGAATADLRQIQANQGVNNLYMIKPIQLVRPTRAQLTVSGKLRTLIAVLALGAILLLVVVSMSEALARRRPDRPDRPDLPPQPDHPDVPDRSDRPVNADLPPRPRQAETVGREAARLER